MSKSVHNSTEVTLLTAKEVQSPDFDFVAAVAGIASTNGVLADGSNALLWNAARILSAARVRKLIGKSDEAIWTTQSDYTTAAGYKSSSAGTLLTRLGKAQDMGVQHGTQVWTFLTSYADSGRVGEAFKSLPEGAKRADLVTALKPLMDEVSESGRLAAKAGETRGAAKKAASEKGEQPEAPKREVSAVVTAEDILVALHALRVPASRVKPEGWTKVREAFLKFVADEDHARALVEKGQNRPSPADMPKSKTA